MKNLWLWVSEKFKKPKHDFSKLMKHHWTWVESKNDQIRLFNKFLNFWKNPRKVISNQTWVKEWRGVGAKTPITNLKKRITFFLVIFFEKKQSHVLKWSNNEHPSSVWKISKDSIIFIQHIHALKNWDFPAVIFAGTRTLYCEIFTCEDNLSSCTYKEKDWQKRKIFFFSNI